MSDESADILDAAADRLTGKWTTGQLREPAAFTGSPPSRVAALDTCKVDGIGAICWAISGDPTDPGDITMFTDCLRAANAKAVQAGAADLAGYNDAPGRTVGQVQTLLHNAATAERA